MNRLQNMRGYLCGAIEFDKNLGRDWRETIQRETVGLGIHWLNPCKKPIDIGYEDLENHEGRRQLKKDGKWDEIRDVMKIVRCVDLRMVDIADFLIVNIDISLHTCGTYEELFLANRQKKPIIVRIKQGKVNAPDWLFATLPHQMLFSTWQEVQWYLRHVARNRDAETHNRWYFFNWSG